MPKRSADLPIKRQRRSDQRVSLYFSDAPETEFGYFGNSFHEASRTLVRRLRRKRGFGNVEALPVLFLYRHTIELFMKAIVIEGDGIWFSDPQERRRGLKDLATHDLRRLLNRVESVFTRHDMTWWWPRNHFIETWADVRALIGFLDENDRNADAFRYPINTKGEHSTATNFELSFFAFVTVLDELALALDCSETCLKER